MKNLIVIFLLMTFFFFSACKKDDLNGDIEGSQSPIGEIGNTITLRAGQFGISDTEIHVTKLENGVSTFVCSGVATDSDYLDLLKMIPSHHIPGTVTIDGNNVEMTINAKVTDEGGQVIFNDGSKFTLVNYNAKVGDKYTVEVGGSTLVNEVVSVSSEDDYFWGGMYIKVITIRSSSGMPGVSYVEHYYNHHFGLVGLAIYFEDGSIKYAGIEC